jgi:biotin operon repressor
MSANGQIIRAKHTPENSTVISKKIVRDLRTSPTSLCIIVFLLSYADSANPQPLNIEQGNLAKELGISKGIVRKSLHQLEEHGYLIGQSNGHFILPVSTITENTLSLTATELEAWDDEIANQ